MRLVHSNTYSGRVSQFFHEIRPLELHRHFKHPSCGELFKVMKCAGPNQADEVMRKLLERITKYCDTFQTFSGLYQRFRVSLPLSEIAFNKEFALDLM